MEITPLCSTALSLLHSLGGVTWFDALPPGPARYEAVEMMTREVMRRTGCSEGEARKAVSGAISKGRKEKGNG